VVLCCFYCGLLTIAVSLEAAALLAAYNTNPPKYLRSTLSGSSLVRSARFVGTNHNSLSWPAKLVSHMDVANKNIPDVKVTSMKASSIPSTLALL